MTIILKCYFDFLGVGSGTLMAVDKCLGFFLRNKVMSAVHILRKLECVVLFKSISYGIEILLPSFDNSVGCEFDYNGEVYTNLQTATSFE